MIRAIDRARVTSGHNITAHDLYRGVMQMRIVGVVAVLLGATTYAHADGMHKNGLSDYARACSPATASSATSRTIPT